jgi:hypothetical protein
MSNIKTITRVPDPTTKIITLDMDADELADANGKAYNIELVVYGAELRGIHFTVNDGAESLAYSEQWQSIGMWLRTPSASDTCIVRNLDAGTPDIAKIYVTGSVFGDGVLTRGTHGAVWGHKDDVGSGHYCTDLNLWIAAP